MNPKFSIVDQETLALLVYTPWWEEGILHGMTLSPFSMVGDYPSPQASEFCRATGASLLVAPKQTHGALFFDARDGESLKDPHNGRGSLARCGEYDGVLVPMSQNLPRETVAYAIATADCVPVVMRGDAGWGLAHAGWRGLANGIIQNVARGLGEVEEVAIFACAGGSAYEVGREVIDAIGETPPSLPPGTRSFSTQPRPPGDSCCPTLQPKLLKPLESARYVTQGFTHIAGMGRNQGGP